MSENEDKGEQGEGVAPNAAPPAEGHVGYKQPPVAHQFKKGRSGNPCGRPRKVERSYTPRQFRRDILRVGNRLTSIKTDKGIIKVTLVEAMILKTAFTGLSGHGPSRRYFLNEYSAALQEHSDAHAQHFNTLEDIEKHLMLNPKISEEKSVVGYLNSLRKSTRRT